MTATVVRNLTKTEKMKMTDKQIKPRQLMLFFIAFLPLTKFFTLPKAGAQIANEDFWISVFICILFDFIAVIFLLLASRKHNASFYEILSANFGKSGANVIFIFYFVYFILKSFSPIYEQFNFLQITLYETAPSSIKYFPFLLIAIYLCSKKLRTIGRLSDILWLITLIGTFLLFTLALSDVDFGSILPIGANGIKIFKGSYYLLNWFTDASYLLFMLGSFKLDKKTFYKPILGFLGHTLLTVGFCIVFYCVFIYISGRELYAIAEISKYSNVINSIGRFDYMAIFCLLIPHTVSIILPLYFASNILITIFGEKYKIVISTIVCLIVYIPLVYLNSYVVGILDFIHIYMTPLVFILGNVFPCFVLLMKKPKGAINELYSG